MGHAQDTRVIPLQLISRRHDHGAWCSRAAPRAVQRWPGGSAHHWHPVPCRAVAGRTPIGALLRCRGSSGGGGAGAMRLPRMRREWARPRRPRGHSALLMVAHQGPPIAMYPPHTSASASTPAHAGASSLRASAASCFCSAASSRSCRRSRQPLLRLRLLWRLLTAPPARAGVPAVPDLRRQGHEVQPKRPDARRDRLQKESQGRLLRRRLGKHRLCIACTAAPSLYQLLRIFLHICATRRNERVYLRMQTGSRHAQSRRDGSLAACRCACCLLMFMLRHGTWAAPRLACESRHELGVSFVRRAAPRRAGAGRPDRRRGEERHTRHACIIYKYISRAAAH